MGMCSCAEKKAPTNRYFDDFVKTLPSMKGKTVAVTGCTSGTGKIFAVQCAKMGAKVLLVNRSSERADLAFYDVTQQAEEVGAPSPVAIPCDLMSFKSVNQAGAQLKTEAADGIDVLCNNAGIMAFNDTATEDRCDIQMQTNHLSHFLLTYHCMPLLEKAASLRGEARIVNHSSAARVMDKMNNKLDEKYLDKNGGNLGGNSNTMFAGANFQRYQQTKLANVAFTYALRDRLEAAGSKVKVFVAHPGVAPTELSQGTMKEGGMPAMPVFAQNMMAAMMMQSEADATIGILRGACDPNAVSGEFYGPLGKGGGSGVHDNKEYNGPHGVLKEEPFADQEARDTLWRVSEKVTGVKFEIRSAAPSRIGCM